MNTNDVVQKCVERHFDADEKVLWTGQPDPRRAAVRALPASFGGIPVTAFAMFFMVSIAVTHRHGALGGGRVHIDWLSAIFGIPILVAGCYLLLAPLWAIRQATRTTYAITSKRAMILIPGRTDSVETFGPRDLQWIRLKLRKNETGDLGFKSVQTTPPQVWWRFDYRYPEPRFEDVGFFGVPNARKVEQLLRDTFHQTDSR